MCHTQWPSHRHIHSYWDIIMHSTIITGHCSHNINICDRVCDCVNPSQTGHQNSIAMYEATVDSTKGERHNSYVSQIPLEICWDGGNWGLHSIWLVISTMWWAPPLKGNEWGLHKYTAYNTVSQTRVADEDHDHNNYTSMYSSIIIVVPWLCTYLKCRTKQACLFVWADFLILWTLWVSLNKQKLMYEVLAPSIITHI